MRLMHMFRGQRFWLVVWLVSVVQREVVVSLIPGKTLSRSSFSLRAQQSRQPRQQSGGLKKRKQQRGNNKRVKQPKEINYLLSREATTGEEILNICELPNLRMTDSNYATALTWLAKRRRRRYDAATSERVEAVVLRAMNSLEAGKWSARSLANAAWGAAKLHREEHPNTQLSTHLEACLELVGSSALRVMPDFKPQELANLAWAVATSGIWSEDLIEAIAIYGSGHTTEFRPQEMSNLLWSYAKTLGPSLNIPSRLTMNTKALFANITQSCIDQHFKGFKPQELANIVWAVATCGYEAKADFWDCAARTMTNNFSAELNANLADTRDTTKLSQSPDLNHQRKKSSSSQFSRPYQQQQRRAGTHYVQLADGTQLIGAQTQNIANFMWAVAKLYPKTCSDKTLSPLLTTASKLTQRRIQQFNSQEIGNMAWAYATLRHRDDKFFDALAIAAAPLLPSFVAQNLANTLWAFASVGRRNDLVLFNAVAKQAQGMPDAFKPQEIANMLWAFATAGIEPPKQLLDAFVTTSSKRLDTFADQGLSNLIWALSAMGVAQRYAGFCAQIAEVLAQRVQNLQPQALSNVVWAFANAEVRADDLFHSVALEIAGIDPEDYAAAAETQAKDAPRQRLPSARAAQLNHQECSNVAWAFAKNGFDRVPELYDALATAILARSGGHLLRVGGSPNDTNSWTSQELANLAWAYACADHVDWALLRFLWSSVVARAQSFYSERGPGTEVLTDNAEMDDETLSRNWGFSMEELRQLHQVVLHIRHEAYGGHAALLSDVARSPPAFLAQLKATYRDFDPIQSRSQRSVARHLKQLGLRVTEEHLTPEGLSVDIAILPTSRRLGVEFDGPWHFFSNMAQEPTGRTRFKMRLLRATGWTVLHIPYYEWTKLTDDEAKKDYLRTNLRALVQSRAKQTASSSNAASLDNDDSSFSPPAKRLRRRSLESISSSSDDDDDEDLDTRDAFSSLRVSELRQLCDARGLDRVVRRSEGDARTVLERRLREHAAATSSTTAGENDVFEEL